MLQENGEVCSRRSGEGGEYLISLRNTTIILISTSIRCDAVLAEQGGSKHNQKYAMAAAFVQEHEAVVLMIPCENMGPN